MLTYMTYTTRFAPTPSGELHFGSLVALTASFLECHVHAGKWFIRFDDLDSKRVKPQFQVAIQQSLDDFGFAYDGIYKQSDWQPLYQNALEKLAPHTFYCHCSRKNVHLCQCDGKRHTSGALRLRMPNKTHTMTDALQGDYNQNLQKACGNMVLKRTDGILSYHLATVVDDYHLKINHIVRGFDLLDSTLRQNHLRQLLDLPQVAHAHVPVALLDERNKYSKQNHAPAIGKIAPSSALWHALHFLQQQPPVALNSAPLTELWQWAKTNWSLTSLCGKQSLIYSPA